MKKLLLAILLIFAFSGSVMAAKVKPEISVVTSTPIYQGDTVNFIITPENSGVVSLTGTRDGVVLWGIGLIRGDTDVVITPSQAWQASPGPLHVVVELKELVNNRVKVIAETSFDIVE